MIASKLQYVGVNLTEGKGLIGLRALKCYVFSTLLDVIEGWTMKKEHIMKLEPFEAMSSKSYVCGHIAIYRESFRKIGEIAEYVDAFPGWKTLEHGLATARYTYWER